MAIKILLAYFLGYIRISVEGYYIERFINFNVSIKDFREVVKIAKKNKCKLKIEKKKGIPFLINKYRKRKILMISIILVIVVIFISSQFVWNIEIKEEKGRELENINIDIKEAGLNTGILKKDINRKEIINKVSLKRKDIAWMGIEIRGTNVIISLAKAEEKPQIINEDEFCSIVSEEEGVITKINAQNGTANVRKGDIIKKGTTLINGWIEGKYTGLRYVHARGEVEANVWHTKSVKIPYKTTEKRKTGNEENKYFIKIGKFEINLSKRVSKFKIYDRIDVENKIRVFSDFYLPISIKKVTLKEEIEEEKTYCKEDAKSLGIKQLEEEFRKEIKDENKIVNKNINIYENEEDIEIYLTYEVLEKIGTEERIVF